MSHSIELPELQEFAPEPPPHGPRVWLSKNLFSSRGSSALSVVFIALVVFSIRGLLGFIFSPDRRWEAVTTNTRLMMLDAYPEAQILRVWISIGIIAVLLAVSFVVYRAGGRISPRSLGTKFQTIGASIVGAAAIGPWGLSVSPFGVHDSKVALTLFLVGAALVGIGFAAKTIPGEAAKDRTIPMMGIIFGVMVVVIVAIWTVQLPLPGRDAAGKQISTLSPIANTTKEPWTAILLIAAVAYVLSKLARDRVPEAMARKTIVSLWILAFPVLVLVILRDPGLDYGKVLGFYVPAVIGFVVVGGFILNFIAGHRGELGRIVGAALMLVAIGSFLMPMEFVLRFLFLSLAMFGLAAPTFGGEGSGRRRFLTIWLAAVIIITYFVMMITAPSTVEVVGNRSPFGGLQLTFILSIVAIALSFPLGVVLALGRTSKMPVFRLMSTGYIELVRGVPLITWLIVAFIMLPVALPPGVEIGGMARAIGAMALFSAAYLAENVRGGLQSIPKGQYEAAQAMGLTTSQTTAFIVLPQALRAVIPALVGQVISLFKDTSLVTIVGLNDFLNIARVIVPGQTQPYNFLGVMREPLLYTVGVYWIFSFIFSRISHRLEKKLGVGER